MGSSPVTATTPLPDSIADAFDRAFGTRTGTEGGILVAFSGGPDSTALLTALASWAPERGLRLEGAHLDHGLDPDSARRADRARSVARQLAVPLICERLEESLPRGESLEAWARQRRYAFLVRCARERALGAIATAHHADDQAETLILRLAQGSGLVGLAGIRRWHGKVVRPFLDLRRQELSAFVEASGLVPVDDPTNCDLDRPRNRVRHLLIPRLATGGPDVVPKLSEVARRVEAVVGRIDRRLVQRLGVATIRGGARLDRRAFEALPEELLPLALALLARRAGATYPAATSVRRELLRQLAGGGQVGCDVAGDWRLEADGRELRWLGLEPSMGRFAYTGELPGVVEIPELALQFRLERTAIAPWMFEGRPDRAALDGEMAEGTRVTIRNRRPGDRIQPLGRPGGRRLKELLIDHRIPRRQRDRLPLLLIDGDIAWVPGVTIGHRFRLRGDSSAWRVTLEDLG